MKTVLIYIFKKLVVSIEIISNAQQIVVHKNDLTEKNKQLDQRDQYNKYALENVDTNASGKNIASDFGNMRISNQMIEQMLNEDDNGKIIQKKVYACTKCKDSNFNDPEELRNHFKSNWHKFNAKQSAHGKESLSAEDYDDYILMHPEALA